MDHLVAVARRSSRPGRGVRTSDLLARPCQEDHLRRRRRKVIKFILYVAVGYLVFMGAYNSYCGDRFLATIDFGFGTVLVGLLLGLRSGLDERIVSYIGLTGVSVFFTCLVFWGGANGTGIIWLCSFPLVAVFFLGARLGAILAVALLAVNIIGAAWLDSPGAVVPHASPVLLRLALVYGALLAFGCMFEVGRDHFERQLEGRNQELAQKVSELEQAQRSLASAKRAAELASEAKSTFLATMSHEIRTPMNGVVGMTELLLETPMTEEQKDFAQTIRNSSDSLLTIINDILDFSKVEAGKLRINEAPVDLAEVMDRVIDLLSARAYEKGLELALVVHPSTPRYVISDAGRLRQVLVNLLGNAVKFTDSGEVVARLERTASGAFRFSVTDTGPGIPPDKLPRLFHAFSQVDESATRRHGGTGLGLAISRQLIELMGGQISVRSDLGRGSCFTAEVPLDVSDPMPTFGGDKRSVPSPLPGRIVVAVPSSGLRAQLATELGGKDVDCLFADDMSAVRSVLDGDEVWRALVDESLAGEDLDDLLRRPEVTLIRHRLAFRAEWPGGCKPRLLLKPLRHGSLWPTLVEKSADEETPVSIAETAPAIASHDHPRILVAEDNPVNRKLAVHLLRRLGYEPETVDNGEEAVEAARQETYAAVLMDVQMPVLDGLAATRRLRDRHGFRTPIIALTANALPGVRDECLQAGMDDYLTKPIDRRSLQDKLAHWAPRGGTAKTA